MEGKIIYRERQLENVLNLKRFLMSGCGALAGLVFWRIANNDYFLKYSIDKLGTNYAVASTGIAFLLAWLVHVPKSWRSGLANIALALAVSAMIAYATLLLHVNSVFNNYGVWGL